jgi:hypothetical protein
MLRNDQQRTRESGVGRRFAFIKKSRSPYPASRIPNPAWFVLLSMALSIASSAHAAGCDVNSDASTNVADVQVCVNQAISVVACTTGDIDANGQCNVVDVQRVVNAALGGQCVSGGTGASGCPLPAYPDATCTGVPAGTALTVVNGNMTINTANAIVENKDIRGCIMVTAPGVIIRNSKIKCTDAAIAIDAYQVSGTWLKIQDCEIDCGNRGGSTAIGEEQVTSLRNNIYGCENGYDVNKNMTIQDNYIHDLYLGNGTDDPHTDGIQMWDTATGVVIQHNRIFPGLNTTSAIISPGSGTLGTIIKENLFAGGAYTVYCRQGGPGGQQLINNHFSTVFSPKVGAYAPWTDCQDETLSGNVYHETGLPVTPE